MTEQKHFKIWKFNEECNFRDYTLIIPSVAVGNVAQLTCDLLISSLNMRKVASIYSTALIPVIGYDPYDLNSSKLSTNCEIYLSDSRKLVVLQIRAPLVHKYARAFLDDILLLFREKCIKDILILTSSFAHEKKNIMTSSFRYVANEWSPSKDRVKSLNWYEFDYENGSKVYGGGFASLLYDKCVEHKIPCLMLFKYCSEGDNIPDAYEMVNHLANLMPLFSKQVDIQSQLVQPVSWKLLFGRPPPLDIY